MQAVPNSGTFKTVLPYFFWFVAVSYFAFRIIERIQISYFSDVLGWIGSFWLAAMIFIFIAILFFDLLRAVNYFFPFFPDFIMNNYSRVKFILFNILTIAVLLIVAAGYINARYPVVRQLNINLDKMAGEDKILNAVLISDIHLGTLTTSRQISRLIKIINSLQPDIIFMAGDILDEDVESVARKNLGEKFQMLEAPLGVYAVLGNHEYIGGYKNAVEYLSSSGINVIQDTALLINNSFYLIGRDDLSRRAFTGEERKSLEELLAMTEHELPLILLDHQPYSIIKAANYGFDIQLSGHTHHGQIWPINYITKAIFPVSTGYKNINGMHVYVTSGVGTWGPPVRIGNRPEIVNLKIRL